MTEKRESELSMAGGAVGDDDSDGQGGDWRCAVLSETIV